MWGVCEFGNQRNSRLWIQCNSSAFCSFLFFKNVTCPLIILSRVLWFCDRRNWRKITFGAAAILLNYCRFGSRCVMWHHHGVHSAEAVFDWRASNMRTVKSSRSPTNITVRAQNYFCSSPQKSSKNFKTIIANFENSRSNMAAAITVKPSVKSRMEWSVMLIALTHTIVRRFVSGSFGNILRLML